MLPRFKIPTLRSRLALSKKEKKLFAEIHKALRGINSESYTLSVRKKGKQLLFTIHISSPHDVPEVSDAIQEILDKRATLPEEVHIQFIIQDLP